MYNPRLGTFISEDPLGFLAGDTNLRRYVHNSPTNFVDPSGQRKVSPLALMEGAFGKQATQTAKPSSSASAAGKIGTALRCLDSIAQINAAAAAMVTENRAILDAVSEALAKQVNKGTLAEQDAVEILRGVIPNSGGHQNSYENRRKAVIEYLEKSHAEADELKKEENDPNVHHIATNKNRVSTLRGGPWTPKFEELFKRAGMSLEDPLNKVAVPNHQGPHPEEYHREVFERLRDAVKGKKGDEYTQALKEELVKLGTECQTPGTKLNGLITRPPVVP